MKKGRYQRGDIVRVCLNPTVGREQQGDLRPCLVLSPADFNKLGTVLVAPITQAGDFARVQGFAVTLSGCGSETQGVVLVNGIRMLDLDAKKAKKLKR